MPAVSTIDFVIIIGYLIAVTLIGAWFLKREKTSTDYYLAGRNVKWPFIGASLFATNISAEHYVAYAGGAYAMGIIVGTTELLAPLNLCVLAVLFLPYYLRSQVFTIPEFLEKRFNPACRMILSCILLVLNVFTRLAVALWAGALIMKTLAGWNTTATIWLIGTLTAVYTLMGGLAAVIYTEFLQTIIMYGGSLFLAYLSIKHVGGVSALLEKLPEQHLHWARSIHDPELPWTAWTLPWFLGGMFYWCMDQTIVQRALSAKNLDHARKASIFTGFIKVGHLFLFVLPGLCALILFPNLAKSDEAYPRMIAELMPVGLRGLILSAILAAIMSTLASTYNSTATLIVHDFLLRKWPNLSQKRQIHIGWVIIVAMALLGVFWAPYTARFDSLWNYIMRVSVYLQMPVVSIFMLGLLWRRTGGAAALAGMAVGVVIGMICLYDDLNTANLPILSYWLLKPFPHRGFLALIASGLTAVIWTLLTTPPRPKSEIDKLTVDWNKPQLLTAEPGPVWKDWRLWLVALIALDLFFYFKLM